VTVTTLADAEDNRSGGALLLMDGATLAVVPEPADG
jgi:hypothetical protein